jgi:hypothetical protein
MMAETQHRLVPGPSLSKRGKREKKARGKTKPLFSSPHRHVQPVDAVSPSPSRLACGESSPTPGLAKNKNKKTHNVSMIIRKTKPQQYFGRFEKRPLTFD